MKTPEEIKKGLECCIKYMACAPAEECCDLCPFHGRCGSLEKDVLAYIQQLEAQNAELVRKTEQLKEGASFTLTVKEQDVKGAVKKAYESFEIEGKKLSEWIKLLADYKRKDWISVERVLPENGQQVLIYDGNATQWKASVHSARFVKGRTHDEIMAEYRDTGRLWHTFGDEEGNNKKPYAWRGDAHMQWFGQQVTHWMPLPEPPMEETGHV